MKKAIAHTIGGLLVVAASTTAFAAYAQTYTSAAPTPVFYNASGTAVNPGSTTLAPGWYYNQSGQSVYYYGDGSYYNPETGTYYGGNGSSMAVANPSAGIAAEAATIPSTTGATTATTPSAPNTGAGGDAAANIIILAVSGLIAAGGITYLVKSLAERTEARAL